MLSLKNRGVLVAGTRRIGADVVKRLAEEGMNIAITYRTSSAEAQVLLNEIAPKVDRTCLIRADLAVEEDVIRTVAEAADKLGDLSFLINMASDYERIQYNNLDGAAWERGMAAATANYLLALHTSRLFMQNEGPTRGHMIFFGDWAAGETPYHEYLPYLTAKAAIHYMTRIFAMELAGHGILVNAIAPGPTEQAENISDAEWQKDVLPRVPLRRESSAQEIAELIITLLKSETITGDVIRVDAGRHLAGP